MGSCGHWPIHPFLAHGTLRSIHKPFSAPIVCNNTGYHDNADKNWDIENWLWGGINRTGSIKVHYCISSPWPNQLKLDPQSHPCQLRRPSRGAGRPLPDFSRKLSRHFPPTLQLVQSLPVHLWCFPHPIMKLMISIPNLSLMMVALNLRLINTRTTAQFVVLFYFMMWY